MPKAKKAAPGRARRTGFPIKFYRKLVRDGIPRHIERQGAKPTVLTLRGPVLLRHLKLKLREEIAELDGAIRTQKPAKIAEEAGDVCEVLRALTAFVGVPWRDVKRARKAKLKARGGFEKGLLLVSTREAKQKTVTVKK